MLQSRSALVLLAFLLAFLILVEGKDLYKILGVDKNADQRAIKKAFHKLSLQYHPDKNKAKNANEKFTEISNAYEILSDEKKRREYDLRGDAGGNGGNGGGGGDPFGKYYHQQYQDGNSRQQRHQHHHYTYHSEGPRGFSFEDFGFGGFDGFHGFNGFDGFGSSVNDIFSKFSRGSSHSSNSEAQHYPSQLQHLSSADFTSRVVSGSESWLLLFVSSSVPERRTDVLEEFARHMNGVIKVGIIDCFNNRHLCKEQHVPLHSEPRLYLCPWVPSRERSLLRFTGEWKVEALEAFSVEYLPKLLTSIVGDDYSEIFENHDGLPRAILLTKKKETPALWRAVSGVSHDRILFFHKKVRDTSDSLARKLTVTSLPAVIGVLANSEAMILSQGKSVNFHDLKKLIKDLETKNAPFRKNKREAKPSDGVSKLTKDNFGKLCSDKVLCVIAVVKTKKAEENARKILREVSKKKIQPATRTSSLVAVSYVYVDAATQASFMKAFGDNKLQKQDPGLMIFKARKLKFATHTGPFTAAAIENFVSGALNGDLQFRKVKRL